MRQQNLHPRRPALPAVRRHSSRRNQTRRPSRPGLQRPGPHLRQPSKNFREHPRNVRMARHHLGNHSPHLPRPKLNPRRNEFSAKRAPPAPRSVAQPLQAARPQPSLECGGSAAAFPKAARTRNASSAKRQIVGQAVSLSAPHFSGVCLTIDSSAITPARSAAKNPNATQTQPRRGGIS
jgi:hypothetical protein